MGDRSDTRSIDQALRVLYSEYDGAVRAFIAKQFTQNSELIDEVVQDTFVEVWKFPERYNDEYTFKTWLLGIARHKAIDALRKLPAASESVELFAHTLPASAHDVTDVIYQDQVNELLKSGLTQLLENGKLSADHREVLQLMYVNELNVTEIAAIIRCPENTVKTRLHYARERVRSHFETCLKGFIFHDNVEKFLESTKIDQTIDHNKPHDTLVKHQNTDSGFEPHLALVFGLPRGSIPQPTIDQFHADYASKPQLDLILPSHFQNFVCTATNSNEAKLVTVLPAQNEQLTTDLSLLDSAGMPSNWAQTLDILVSAGSNAKSDGVATKTTGGEAAGTTNAATHTSVDGGSGDINTNNASIAHFPSNNNDLNDHGHPNYLNNLISQGVNCSTDITTGNTEQQLSHCLDVSNEHTGNDHSYNDIINHQEIETNPSIATIQLIGLPHDHLDTIWLH